MGIIASVLKSLHAEEITAKEAPHLIKAMEEMAAKAGIKVPKLHVIRHPLFGSMPNAGAIGRGHIGLTERLFHVLESPLAGEPSKEMLAILGHEMFHNKHMITNWTTTRLPPLLAPIAAATGLHFYEKAKRKTKNKEDKEAIHKAIEEVVIEEHEALRNVKAKHLEGEIEKHTKKTGHALITAAKYVAVTAAGLGAGLYASRQFSRMFEFAADAHGAKLVGAEAMGSALKKLHAYQRNIEEEMVKHGGSAKPRWLLKLASETILAHPSETERLARLGVTR